MKKKIQNIDDIKLLIDEFYKKVREDTLLSSIFNEVIKDNWPEHLEKMYQFWETILLDKKTYRGNPFMPHAELPIDKIHFDRWLALFHRTLDEKYIGQVAEVAKWRSNKMAEMFQMKLEYYKNPNLKPLL